jgi:serine/threonine-protein kinase mTOR
VHVDCRLPFAQLIARIQTPSYIIRSQINVLLTQVGRVHPQALIYPLTVASKSNSQLRHMAAEEIMDRLREHSALLVEQVRPTLAFFVYF